MKKSTLWLRSALVGALPLLSLSFTQAQGIPSVTYLNVPQKSVFLLLDAYTAKQAQLTPVQLKQVQSIQKTYNAKTLKLESEKVPRPEAFKLNDLWLANAYLALLKPEQKDHFLKLAVRQIGTNALVDETVAIKVGLSQIQLKKIREILNAQEKRRDAISGMEGDAMAAVPEPKPGQSRTAYDAKMKAIIESYNGEQQQYLRDKEVGDKSILALMTPIQKAKWQSLVAEPATPSKH